MSVCPGSDASIDRCPGLALCDQVDKVSGGWYHYLRVAATNLFVVPNMHFVTTVSLWQLYKQNKVVNVQPRFNFSDEIIK